ncbi:MAG TPA: hypothetical protein VED84_08395 [Acidimicrobiales bacterium]|nr:hypothetical protein [Acidimicrobiales bacterium]
MSRGVTTDAESPDRRRATKIPPTHTKEGARNNEASRDPYPESAQLAYADLAELRRALDTGETTSVELAETLLARIAAIDSAGPRLHAVLAVGGAVVKIAPDRDTERVSGAEVGPCTASRSS